jgi:hypothetical protein
MQSIKEKKLLLKFAMQMGQPVDPALVEEVRKYDEMQNQVSESIRSNILDDLKELFEATAKLTKEQVKEVPVVEVPPQPEPVVLEEVKEVKRVEQPIEPPSLIQKSVAAIEKAEKSLTGKEDSYQQPSVPAPADLKAVKDKIKFLEQWIGKISLTGPGGGAASIENLDHATKLVTTNYAIQKSDYYVGVNASSPVTITLPSSSKNGRYIIIKDESGRCSKHPIIVHGNVDNDPQGFILKIDNGGIQMIYRNGWRIV